MREIVVTGNPLGADQVAVPVQQLQGTGLLLRNKSTLGETLDGLPGVASTYFGPNASRPVIRGLDGDRIRVLSNGSPLLDASGLSYDHAVASDPLGMERIEVLRGPGALLYGGSAAGGVVNLLDGRIATEPLFDAQGGVLGRVDVSGASGDGSTEAAVLVEGGNDRFALHADLFRRRSDDVAAPADLTCTKPGAPALARRICNSSASAEGGAVGATWFLPKGYVGVSTSSHLSDYGTVAEDEVTIRMRSTRTSLQAGLRGLTGPIEGVELQANNTRYTHTEFDAGAAGTVFNTDGTGLRLQVRHAALGPGRQGSWGLHGVLGVSQEKSDFSADGTEAFAPYSNSKTEAVFVHEELRLPWGRVSLGARWEQATVTSLGHPSIARFAPGSRGFQPQSQALGVVWNATPSWTVSANLARSERAPKDYELYADGPHVATNAYEVGLPNAQVEQSRQFDLGVQWKRGAHSFGVSAFVNEFANYLLLDATGIQRDSDGNGGNGVSVTDSGNGDNTSAESGGTANILPEFAYSQVPARFIGWEVQGRTRLLEGPSTLDLDVKADLVRASNTSTGQALPRIAPARVGAGLTWTQGLAQVRLDVQHVAAQNDVPAGQTATGAYTLVNLGASYQQKLGKNALLWHARVDNLTDQLAYSATSILTQTAPGESPLPGRSLKLGVRLSF